MSWRQETAWTLLVGAIVAVLMLLFVVYGLPPLADFVESHSDWPGQS